MTHNDLINHISSISPEIGLSKVTEDHENNKILITVLAETTEKSAAELEKSLNSLQIPYEFGVSRTGISELKLNPIDDVFSIGPAKAKKELCLPLLEREERLWFDNLEGIYSGEFTKSDLYFCEPEKTSCFVNLNLFQNANLRNHLLLYDVIYCLIPLAEDMGSLLEQQKITKDEILQLVQNGRLKIVNLQPEHRIDYGFFNEVFQTNNNSIISRLGVSALCATNLVEMNKAYVFSAPELREHLLPMISAISEVTKKPFKKLADFMLWPQFALRSSFETLSRSGPMAISRYGVNNLTEGLFPQADQKAMEFEFTVNSSPIHIAHALDATYFPFFTDKNKYTDHPYALVMGQFLNFFQSTTFERLDQRVQNEVTMWPPNLSMRLIDTFEINDYISISDFEQDIASAVTRKGMQTLFSELNELEDDERTARINTYNTELKKALKTKGYRSHGLDLANYGVDAALNLLDFFVPLLGTAKKGAFWGAKKAKEKIPAVQAFSEIVEEKLQSSDPKKRNVSLLSRVNRVARLKRTYE